MLTMGIEHYDQPMAIFFILEVSNAFFTTVFGLGKCREIQISIQHIPSNDQYSFNILLLFSPFSVPLFLIHNV